MHGDDRGHAKQMHGDATSHARGVPGKSGRAGSQPWRSGANSTSTGVGRVGSRSTLPFLAAARGQCGRNEPGDSRNDSTRRLHGTRTSVLNGLGSSEKLPGRHEWDPFELRSRRVQTDLVEREVPPINPKSLGKVPVLLSPPFERVHRLPIRRGSVSFRSELEPGIQDRVREEMNPTGRLRKSPETKSEARSKAVRPSARARRSACRRRNCTPCCTR